MFAGFKKTRMSCYNIHFGLFIKFSNTVRRGVVSTSPNPQAGGPPLVGCPWQLIQFIHRYPPYWRPFLRTRHAVVTSIKMDLQEVGEGRGDWMELAQDRDRWRALVGTVRDFRVP